MARTSFAALIGAVVLAGIAASNPVQAQVIGVSWSNFQEERWKTDEAAIKAAIEAAGGTYVSADAQSLGRQADHRHRSLIARGAKALIVLAQDADAIRPAVEKAIDEGIPVIGYDRLIEMKDVLYITFDNKEVGRIQAREVFKVKPEGNYVFIKGSSAPIPTPTSCSPARWKCWVTRSRPARSRTSARPTPTAGCRPTRSGTWSSS